MRSILDIFIFFARHLVLTFAVIFVCAWFFSRRQACSNRTGFSKDTLFGHLPNGPTRRWVTVGSLGLLGIFGAIGVWYMNINGFAGEVEPVVSCLSWLVQSGQPLYNDFDAAERYSVLYGPSVFLTNGLFLKILGPSLASAKLASVFGTTGSLIFLYAALARRQRDLIALGITALAVLYYWTQGFAVYLVRPDALLLFAVGLGLFAAVRQRRWLALLTVAATAGFAINLKAHGAVYFLPIFVLVLQRYGRRDVLLTGLGTLVFVISPFFLYPQVSLVNYLGWLTNAMGHGLETHTLALTFRYAGFLLLPIIGVVLAASDRRRVLRENRLELAALVPVYGLTLLLASKPGAGPVHLLPLVPTTMYLLGTLAQTTVFGRNLLPTRLPLRQALVLATVFTAVLSGSVNAYRAVRFVDYQIGQTPELAQDVQEIMRLYPELTISMACGGENKSFRATWLRPLLVFADNPLLIDPISVMDSSLSGRGLSPETYRALSEGRVSVWLVPRSEVPFDKENWYEPHNELFPSKFQEHFRACYTPRGHSRYFDLWFWNGLPEVEAEMPHYAAGFGGMGAVMAPVQSLP